MTTIKCNNNDCEYCTNGECDKLCIVISASGNCLKAKEIENSELIYPRDKE